MATKKTPPDAAYPGMLPKPAKPPKGPPDAATKEMLPDSYMGSIGGSHNRGGPYQRGRKPKK